MHSIKLTRYKIPNMSVFSQKLRKLAQDVLENPVTYQHNLSQGILLSAQQQTDYSLRLWKDHRFDHTLHCPWFPSSLSSVTFRALPGCVKYWKTPSDVMICLFTHSAAGLRHLMAFSTLVFRRFCRLWCPPSALWLALLPPLSKSWEHPWTLRAAFCCLARFFHSAKGGFWSLPMSQWALKSLGEWCSREVGALYLRKCAVMCLASCLNLSLELQNPAWSSIQKTSWP